MPPSPLAPDDQLQELARFDYAPTTCPVCGAAEAKERYVIRTFPEGAIRFVRCQRCRLLYQSPRLADRSLDALFTSNAYISARRSGRRVYGYFDYLKGERFRALMARDRLRRLSTRFADRTRLRILEIGCATGTFLREARDLGHEVAGVDVSAYFVGYARRVYGLDVARASIDEYDTDRRFDLVCAWGTLSALRRPFEAFQRIHALLEPDGIVTFNYPDADSLMARVAGSRYSMLKPSCVAIYNRTSVARLLEATGFAVLSHRTDVQYANLEKLATFMKSRLLGRLGDLGRLHDVCFRIPTPGIYWIIARKGPTDG